MLQNRCHPDGYHVVGLLPDVNGAGRPYILMVKSLAVSSPAKLGRRMGRAPSE